MTATVPQTAPILDVRGLRKVYQGGTRSVETIRDLTFSIRPGELVCIVGPSGAGKTTLLKRIAGLLDVTEGQVVLEGKAVTGPPAEMAVVFQDYGRSLFPWMTVRQNVELPLKERGTTRSERDEIVARALESVGSRRRGTRAHPYELPAGCSSASRSPAPSRTSRNS